MTDEEQTGPTEELETADTETPVIEETVDPWWYRQRGSSFHRCY